MKADEELGLYKETDEKGNPLTYWGGKTNLDRLLFPELVEELSKYYKETPIVEKEEGIQQVAKNFANYNEQVNKAIQEAVKFGARWQQKCILELLITNGYEDEPIFDLIENYFKRNNNE
jgi:molecular chaperone GrpE (heat shock protein)